MVLSWLINSMHFDVSSDIMYCETAREMWLELQRVFSQGNGPKIYNLQQEISQITQSQLSVTEYYSKFKKLWDQLLHYEPLPACTCGAMKILSIAHEKSYVMRFLMGLNENFETVRSHILMLEPFPSMSKVYALILQEEAHKGIGHGHGSAFIPNPDSFPSCDDVVAPTSSAGNDSFVTPISVPDFVPNDIDNASFPSSISTGPILDNAITFSLMSTAVSPSPSQVLSPAAPSSSPPVVPASPMPLRKSARDIRPPAYLQDYACTTFAPGAAYDLTECITYSHLDPGYQSYLMTVGSSPQEPLSFSQAVQDPLWRAAMDKEIQALENNHTWDVTNLPPSKLPIGCKWVYKVKFNPDGSVERYKAKLVAKGYTQRE